MRVLYVEDDPFDADLTRRELSKSAPDVDLQIARTQKEALQWLKDNPPYDLVLTDLRLPDGGGFALLAHIRERGLPMAVVVITGQGDEETAVSVLKAGADDYVVKRENYLSSLAMTLEATLQRYRMEVARRARQLRVLYVEQNPVDIDAARAHFASHAPHIHLDTARTVAELLNILPVEAANLQYDALLLDYRLDSLNTLELLKEIRQVRGLDLPIVLVSGHGDELVAVQALRLGASDYLVKSPGYLYQLPGLLENAYHRTQLMREQAALKASEKRFRALIENSADGVLLLDAQGQITYASPSTERILGYPLHHYVGLTFFTLLHVDQLQRVQALWMQILEEERKNISIECLAVHADGTLRWLEATAYNALQESAVRGIVLNFRDITERKKAEEHIRQQLQRLNALRTVDMTITTSLDLRVTLTVLLDHVVTQLGVDAAAVLLFNSYNQTLEFAAGRGFRSHWLENVRLRLGQGYAGKAALERRTVSASAEIIRLEDGRLPDIFLEENFVLYYGTPLVVKGQIKGVLEVYHRDSMDTNDEWLSFLETLAGQAAIAIDNAELFAHLQRANLDLTLAYDSTLEGWVRALDLRDRETQGHTQRVAEMTVQLAREMGASEESLVHIRRGALLHDIGKIGVSDNILLKPGSLSEEEWQVIRQHPQYAFEMLYPISYLRSALDIPYCHHEKWDGTGYPRGLKGEQIPLAARIFAAVDVWDALSNDRPYRVKWEKQRVREHICFLSGTHFDPRVAEAFLRMIDTKD